MKQSIIQFPILSIPTNNRLMHSFNSPILFYPCKQYPDESFMPLSIHLVPNQMPNRYIVSNYGYIWDCYMNQMCPPRSNSADKSSGYLRVHIAYYKDPFTISTRDIYVHRAVLMSFNYRPGCEALQVDHRDTDKWNNKLNNLFWATTLENNLYSLNKKLSMSGLADVKERNKLSKEQVYDVCMKRMQWKTLSQISAETGLHINTIRNIIKHETHRDITSKFNFPEIRNDRALTDMTVHEICKCMESGESNSEIAEKFSIPKSTVSDIRSGRSYKNIRAQYTNIIGGSFHVQ